MFLNNYADMTCVVRKKGGWVLSNYRCAQISNCRYMDAKVPGRVDLMTRELGHVLYRSSHQMVDPVTLPEFIGDQPICR